MSKKKVVWCLNKAKRELKAGRSHRGLVKSRADPKTAQKHIAKAEHNFRAALEFERSGFSDWSVSAVFYSMYHCFLAIITARGFESRNQECTIALIEFFKKDGLISLLMMIF